ncbi:MAG: MotA/TolQ/ExbB proton channel family protein [Myxococcaceae bacterium]|nr:MotA/TolQ/ExbB proton channel family protein [Myxococcaceae bacterium]MCI0673896.1 MotA/TolQ/ExbB proton channel family protein [Myxococcaceae bacterium]
MNIIEQFKSLFLELHANWVMWLMLGLFVVGLFIIGERAAFFLSLRDDIAALARELDALLRKGQYREALQRVARSRSAAAAVVAEGLKHADLGPAAAEKAMAGALAMQRMRLERGLAFLGTLGNNTPFVGLLGTVIGIIGAFEALGTPETGAPAAGTLAPTAIMSSIAEALVATAVGLLVAIPCVAAFNFFQRQVQSTLAGTEALSNVLLSHLSAEPEGRTEPVQVPAAVVVGGR